MKSFEKLLLENKAWAAEKVDDDPKFFERLAHIQTPEFLWIGCSDSRVPANEVTGTDPGEIFVHRNIANLVVEDDLNVLCVLEYAVTHLKVDHVIVCGHYGCGGIKAAMGDQSLGVLDKWLINIKKVYQEHFEEINSLATPEDRANLLTEYNVKQQVVNLSRTETIKKAWASGHRVNIHGWAYGLKDGILNQISHIAPPKLDEKYVIV
ncbi:MAG: carbonic anhydrase [Chitinophagaceae bacterium]|nr:MAG: carbonic anhydrase [Chitinophagaceae bacterium]